MKMMKCGARGSRLSVVQAEGAIRFLAAEIDGFRAALYVFETPGDRDLTTPIERSAPDFFTRDLDDAVRAGDIDFAIHSAKDLPESIAEDLDWFWLPNREDPRDCWVMRSGSRPRSAAMRIGVSSARREAYARNTYPKAKLLPIRGAIDSRLRQIAEGKFDAALMAIAGLKRLFPEWDGGKALTVDGKIHLQVVPVSLDDLQPPDGQGFIAIVFRRGDERMMEVRRRFVRAVRFTSAGVGDAGLITVRGAWDIEEADVVLADCCGLNVASRLLRIGHSNAIADGNTLFSTHKHPMRWVNVGKRCGAHAMEQDAITRLICDEARKGRRVVRLKGGDAGLFGRLAEETAALDTLGIPYLVRPGVSALMAATAPNGLLLTKRGEANGFFVSTPRSSGVRTPHAFFMAARLAREMLKKFPPDEPYAMVWDAFGPYERIETGLCGKPRIKLCKEPGLLLVGCAGSLIARKRILLTCSEAIMREMVRHFEDEGWRTVEWPMIELVAREGMGRLLDGLAVRYDAIVLTSPSSARIFLERWGGGRRKLPKLWTCGAGTDAELRRFGVASDIMPESDFSAKGLVDRLRRDGSKIKGLRVLRLRSMKAGRTMSAALRRIGAVVEDVVLYDNVQVRREGLPLPECDAVFFASASGVEAFLDQYGVKALAGKEIYTIGEPTATRCRKANSRWRIRTLRLSSRF